MKKYFEATVTKDNILRSGDTFIITVDDIVLKVFATNTSGYYFKIEKLEKNGKIYSSPRYFYKYIPFVRDAIWSNYFKK